METVNLQEISAKELGELLGKNPEELLNKWRGMKHLHPTIVKYIPPYAIKAWWIMYNDPDYKQHVPFWTLANALDEYESAFLSKSQNRPMRTQIIQNLEEENEREEDNGKEEDDIPMPKSKIPDIKLSFPIPEKFDAGLIDVYANYDSFVLEPQQEFEKKVGKLCFAKQNPHRPQDASKKIHSVVSESEFLERFHIFTNNQLRDWNDWSNMVVIGGAVVGSLLPIPENFSKTKEDIANYYHNEVYTQSDIDIYIFGLSDADFKKKVLALYDHLKKIHKEVLVVRTTFTLTFCTQYPSRHIQIVLGRWNNMEEVLFEPDVDCTCVAFDGKRVWASYRARLSYNKRWIVSNEARYAVRSFPEYESRLLKYSRRGFYIVDKKLEWDKISDYWIKLGKDRLLEHKVVRGRTSISGLRLLICGVKFKEVLEKVDLFIEEKFPLTGLTYGPDFDTKKLRERLLQPIFETSHYGPYEIENPYRTVNSPEEMELHLVDLDQSSRNTGWRGHSDWYGYLFKEDREKEREKLKKQREDYIKQYGREPYYGAEALVDLPYKMPENETVSDIMEAPPLQKKKTDGDVEMEEAEELVQRRRQPDMINPVIRDFVSELPGSNNIFFWANEEILDPLKIEIILAAGFNRSRGYGDQDEKFSGVTIQDICKQTGKKKEEILPVFNWMKAAGHIYDISPDHFGSVSSTFEFAKIFSKCYRKLLEVIKVNQDGVKISQLSNLARLSRGSDHIPFALQYFAKKGLIIEKEGSVYPTKECLLVPPQLATKIHQYMLSSQSGQFSVADISEQFPAATEAEITKVFEILAEDGAGYMGEKFHLFRW